jgi:hypothetical protein
VRLFGRDAQDDWPPGDGWTKVGWSPDRGDLWAPPPKTKGALYFNTMEELQAAFTDEFMGHRD